jgi:hypothetical protein
VVTQRKGTQRNLFFSLLTFEFIAGILLNCCQARAQNAGLDAWLDVKGKHFIVYYQANKDLTVAEIVLRRAEEYYRRIAEQIGYTRYGDFWTWEERAKIFLFPDQQSFVATTGQPAWSQGYSDRDRRVFRSRALVTYTQEKDFYDALLPHEISHLILHDFIPIGHLPIWFDEGVAQLQEGYKSREAQKIMRDAILKGQQMKFSALSRWDVRRESDANVVMIFYAQSLSVVEFLLKQYGSEAFSRLCRNLRDGRTFEESLRNAYTNQIGSLNDLENKWIGFMKK